MTSSDPQLPGSSGPEGRNRALRWAAVGLFLAILVRTAWICDDAFITLRTVDNAVNGLGLRWNVGERVQSFTHPLWALLLTAVYAVMREPYYTTIAVSVALSLAAFAVYALRLAARPSLLLVGAAVLWSSRAFVDFSTSGLENPLTHFLLATFIAGWLGQDRGERPRLLMWASLGLLLTNRLDLGVLVGPAALQALAARPTRREVLLATAGLLPVAAWEVFSIAYYGFPVPNTAYAKLNVTAEAATIWRQGLAYHRDVLARDGITQLAIAAGLALGLWRPGLRSLVAGVGAYWLYVVWFGGDFMTGRFLAAPLFVAVVAATARPFGRPVVHVALAAIVVAAAAALSPEQLPFLTDGDYGKGETVERNVDLTTGIDDERRWYYATTGLLSTGRRERGPAHEWVGLGQAWRAAAEPVVVSGFVGFAGYYAGPGVHIVDCHALTDPLLAQLPSHPHWRVGHFIRRVPAGYVASIRGGANELQDPALRAYYDRLRQVVQGPVWSATRFGTILALNTGRLRPPDGAVTAEPSACDDIIRMYETVLWK